MEVPSKDEAKTMHRLNKDKANAKQRRSKDEAKTKNSEGKTKHTRSKDEANAKQIRSKDEATAFKLPLVRASPSFIKQMCFPVRLLSRFKGREVLLAMFLAVFFDVVFGFASVLAFERAQDGPKRFWSPT